MVIVLLGGSGAGKSTIEKELIKKNGFEKIISYTTRNPRVGEVNGVDYHFTSNDSFNNLLSLGMFAEYDEYSQGRRYGTLNSEYFCDNDKVVVLTPNGFRQLSRKINKSEIFSVLVEANIGTRIKRYIDRCGVNSFTFDDKNEISSRVERDFGMFLGVKDDVNLVVENDENTDITELVKTILKKYEEYKLNTE